MWKAQNKPQFYCENTEIPITDDFEVLGVTIDDKLKFEKHVAKVCRSGTKAYEKAAPLWNKKEHLFCIHPSPFQLLLRNLALLQ